MTNNDYIERAIDDADDATEPQQDSGLEADEGSERSDPSQNQIATVEPPPVPLTEPDAVVIAYQVTDSIHAPIGTDFAIQRHLMHGSLALYAEIAPRDALESVMARLLVGLVNGGMDSFGRAARAGDWLVAREANLKVGIKSTLAATEVIKAFDNHRGRERQKVTVGQVNVQSGGQAIVGNVGPKEKQQQAPEAAAILIASPDPNKTDEG
jgi:hypothetical protein